MLIAVVGIGAPCSGKSAGLRAYRDEHMPNAVIISSSEVRRRLQVGPNEFNQNLLVWRTIFELVGVALRGGQPVLVDATNADPDYRRQLVDCCRRNGARLVIGAWYKEPLENCLWRNRDRRHPMPNWVIEEYHSQLEAAPPSTKEGFDDVLVVTAEPVLVETTA